MNVESCEYDQYKMTLYLLQNSCIPVFWIFRNPPNPLILRVSTSSACTHYPTAPLVRSFLFTFPPPSFSSSSITFGTFFYSTRIAWNKFGAKKFSACLIPSIFLRFIFEVPNLTQKRFSIRNAILAGGDHYDCSRWLRLIVLVRVLTILIKSWHNYSCRRL